MRCTRVSKVAVETESGEAATGGEAEGGFSLKGPELEELSY